MKVDQAYSAGFKHGRESMLRDLKKKIEQMKSYPMVYDSYSGEVQMVEKEEVLNLITNLEE